jgi:hypothetical protein
MTIDNFNLTPADEGQGAKSAPAPMALLLPRRSPERAYCSLT